jgi:hypothetical protein
MAATLRREIFDLGGQVGLVLLERSIRADTDSISPLNLVERLRAVINEPILQVFGEVGILVYQGSSPKIGHFITSMEILMEYVGAICFIH